MASSYKRTIYSCYVGTITQAVVSNLQALLFIPLRELYGLSYTQLGALVFVNFLTQVVCDIVFSKTMDRHGFRPLALIAPLVAAFGLAMFAAVPLFMPGNIYLGFIIATVVFSGAGGIFEISISPILNAVPSSSSKDTAMSLLHSFYAWGQVGVVIITTLLVKFLGYGSWPYIALMWAAFPLLGFFMFLRSPIPPNVPAEKRQGMRELLFRPFTIVALFTIAFGASTELCVSQWSSSFMQKGLGLPKLWGDILGMCFFAAMLGLGRMLYGRFGEKLNLLKTMTWCAALGIAAYVLLAVSDIPVLSVLACGMAGIASSLLWPGTLSLAGAKYPLAGAWLFAILACAGDIGGSAGPWLMGALADVAAEIPFIASLGARLQLTAEQLGLRVSMFAAAVFPLGALLCLLWMGRSSKKSSGKMLK